MTGPCLGGLVVPMLGERALPVSPSHVQESSKSITNLEEAC